MRRYRVLPPAKEELRNASRWYEEQRQGLGHALLDEFEERLAVALERPQTRTDGVDRRVAGAGSPPTVGRERVIYVILAALCSRSLFKFCLVGHGWWPAAGCCCDQPGTLRYSVGHPGRFGCVGRRHD